MPNRRTFLQTLALAPCLLPSRSLWAAENSGQAALVIGNAAYRQSGLVNPTYDAKAMQALLGQAGFSVDLQLDARREAMIEAIERFGRRVQASDTRTAIFYYAGHGAQLDWRNYLLPVDVSVSSAEALKAGCIDLGLLLDQLVRAQKQTDGKTFVIILDACRDNPFGNAFRAPNKGLSQFDAPVGSLLAYATAPGSVASDGEGRNGLYTENLVKELSRPDVRLEDALKRVRLNVRLASGGGQIPWESTSLENDVFIFPKAGKLSEEELERQIEEEIAHWERIKTSRRIEDWVEYLRRFPNGRFSEVAQNRLNRLLVAIERHKSRITTTTPPPAAAAPPKSEQPPAPVPAPQAPFAEIKPISPDKAVVPKTTVAEMDRATVTPHPKATEQERPPSEPTPAPVPATQTPAAESASIAAVEVVVPQVALAAVTDNPYSAGRYPLGRKFTVGDRGIVRESDLLTGVVEAEKRFKVTRVDEDNDRVELNQGKLVFDLMGNLLDSPLAISSVPQQIFPTELQVGKRWTALYNVTFKKGPLAGKTNQVELDVRIRTRETIRVPAGEYQAFLIEATGWSSGDRGSIQLEFKYWVVPGINLPIRSERIKRHGSRLIETKRIELVSIHQAASGLD